MRCSWSARVRRDFQGASFRRQLAEGLPQLYATGSHVDEPSIAPVKTGSMNVAMSATCSSRFTRVESVMPNFRTQAAHFT